MKKKLLATGIGLAAGAGVVYAIKKKSESNDVIFKRIYPEKMGNMEIGKAISTLRDKLEDFQINAMCAADVPMEYLKKTVDNLKSDLVAGEENFHRFMERSESKISSELIKAQMNINAKREEVSEEVAHTKYESQKEKDAAYAKAHVIDAVALNCFALKVMDEAMAATIEAELTTKEYEEAYGEKLMDDVDKILADFMEKEEEV